MNRAPKIQLIVAPLALLAMAAYNLTPFFSMISSSLKTNLEIMSYPATLIPKSLTLASYRGIWFEENFGLFFLNSVISSGATALLSSGFGLFAAYGFSRYRFKGKLVLMGIMVASQMLPGILLVGPYFEVLARGLASSSR